MHAPPRECPLAESYEDNSLGQHGKLVVNDVTRIGLTESGLASNFYLSIGG